MIYLACCIPYDINIEAVSFFTRFETVPFFARIEAKNEAEAMAIGRDLAQKQYPNHSNYTAYVTEESKLEALSPWPWDMVNQLE